MATTTNETSTQLVNQTDSAYAPSSTTSIPTQSTVTFPIYGFADAMSQTMTTMMNMMNETTQDIEQEMQFSSDLVGPLSNAWGQYFQGLLQKDQGNVATAGDNPAAAQAQFNTDNSAATAAATGFGTTSNQLSQEVTTLTTNFSNQSQLAQTAVQLAQGMVGLNVL